MTGISGPGLKMHPHFPSEQTRAVYDGHFWTRSKNAPLFGHLNKLEQFMTGISGPGRKMHRDLAI
jgi:hypothetical protein